MFTLVRSRGARPVPGAPLENASLGLGGSEPILWGESALWREKLGVTGLVRACVCCLNSVVIHAL